MDSEVQRLRFRVRQLEREVRALRNAATGAPEDETSSVRLPDPLPGRRRVLRATAGFLSERPTD